MVTQNMAVSDLDEAFLDTNENEASDSFVVDIQSLSNSCDKDATPSSRITLQRSLSRKGSQRGERIITTLASGGVTDGASHGSLTAGGCNPGEKSTVVPLVGVGSTEGIVSKQPQQTIKITAENRCRKYSRQRSSASMIDPRRVLFFFATLSSMGTIILIYFTLSIGKLSGDDISQAQ